MRHISLLLNTLEHHPVCLFALAFGQVRLQGFRVLVQTVVIPKKETDATEESGWQGIPQRRSR